MLHYKHKKKKMEMIYVCYIICMLHYQELTRKSISKRTLRILRSEIRASYDNDTKMKRKKYAVQINMHEIDVSPVLHGCINWEYL